MKENSTDSADLVASAVAGDPRAFGELIRLHDNWMRAVAYGVLGDHDKVDGALQDAYMKAFRAIGSFRADSKFSTWLNTVVVNTCKDSAMNLAKHSRNRADLGDAKNLASENIEESIVRNDSLHKGLQSLSVDHRSVIVLVDGQGMSYAEAAIIEGVAEKTIASRLSRARSTLRQELNLSEGITS